MLCGLKLPGAISGAGLPGGAEADARGGGRAASGGHDGARKGGGGHRRPGGAAGQARAPAGARNHLAYTLVHAMYFGGASREHE